MKKILLAMLTACLAIGMVGSGAFAWFHDTEASTGNVFTAGTLDLRLGDADEGFGDGVTTTWYMFNMAPGVSTYGPRSVSLQNAGTVAADHVEISFSHSITEGTPTEFGYPASAAEDLAEWIEITLMTYDDVNWLALGDRVLTDANGNGFIDLDDVTHADNVAALDKLLAPFPNHAGMRTLTMTLAFNAGATNDIQGDTLTMTVTFTLNQHSDQ